MDEEDVDLAAEVAALSQPYVPQENTVTIIVVWPGPDEGDAVVEGLLEGAAAEFRTMMVDYGRPKAQVVIKRQAAADDPLTREAGVLVTTDDVTAEFVHDRMLFSLAAEFRERLDTAGRWSHRVHVWNDGLSDWF